MTHVSVKGTINASADDVWKTVSSFSGIEKYLPLVKSSVTEGSGLGAKRTCTVGTPDGKEAKINEEINYNYWSRRSNGPMVFKIFCK